MGPHSSSNPKFLFSNTTTYCFQTWTITSLQTDGSFIDVSGTHNYGQYPFVFHRTCAPRDACVTFELSVPETKEVSYFSSNSTWSYGERNPYRVVVDGVVYAEKHYSFGDYQFDDDVDPFRTSTLAGTCSSSQVCSDDNQSLLSVSLTTGPRDADWDTYNVGWQLQAHYENQTYPHTLEYLYGDFLPDTEYRHLTCFDKTVCTEFGIRSAGVVSGDVADYEVAVDGQVQAKGAECDPNDDDNCYYISTYVGGDCKDDDGLSKGAIAGIAVGAAALGLVGFLVYRRYSQKQNSNEGSDNNNTNNHESNRSTDPTVAVTAELKPSIRATDVEQPSETGGEESE